MNKKLLAFGSLLTALLTGILTFLLFFTYSVSGKITDIASKEPVQGVKVSIAGIYQNTDVQGNYRIVGLRLYQRRDLEVGVPSQYEGVATIRLDYKSRSIQKNLEIEPSLEEIVNRNNIASKNEQYDYLWDLMHPDDKAYWGSKEEYKRILKERDEVNRELDSYRIKSMTIGKNIRRLNTWKSEITNKEYEEVVEVPIENVYLTEGKETPQNTLEYYQKVDGFYHYFTVVKKDELKKFLEDYRKLKEMMNFF